MAEKINCYSLFRDMPREQFSKLLKDCKNKKNKEERERGINPESMEFTPLRVENANSKKDDKRRKEALACRDKAMG